MSSPSPDLSRSQKASRIRELLRTEGDAVGENTRELNRKRYAAVEALGAEEYQRLKGGARAIKERSIEELPELIETLTERVEANGGHVHLARDAADANEYVEGVLADRDAESVVKSKSMTTEEIDVNDAIEADGREVHETDLGEFVIQVAGESPSHLIGPSIHKSRDDIAVLFNERFDLDPPLESAQELTAFAREHVGDRIREADVGMTGANFLVAESGSMALVTNEGNDRKVIEATDTHIAVAGVEKIIPTLADLEPFMELLPRSGSGQPLTSYFSVLSPPVASPSPTDDDREFHLVLLDNGRMAMRDDPDLRETLYCIRCGACANSCANFQHVGGHAFGGETYTGGIGTGWEAGVHGQESAAEFNDLCTGCSRCVNNCPVEIDIPWINTVVRDRINRDESGDLDFLVEGLVPDGASGGASGDDPAKRLFASFGTLAKWGSRTAPLSNRIADTGAARWALSRAVGIDPRRDLPQFRRETLRDWFAARDSLAPGDADREAVLYPDVYTNHVLVERGKGAVRALEALDVAVRIPDVPESGRAPLSQGMIAAARGAAEEVSAALSPHLDAGRDVVVIEPSDLAMFRREYGKLLPDDEFERLRDASVEVMEFVADAMEGSNGADRARFAAPLGTGRVAYHSHCQQRTLGLESPTVSVLSALGYDVATSDVECCGMAGSFGYKEAYYELSVDVGVELADQFTADGMDDRLVVASGTSCTEQLDDLLERAPRHPVELLVPDDSA